MLSQKIYALQDLMSSGGVNLLAVNAGIYLKYLIGLYFHLSERPVLLLVPDRGIPSLFYPELEHNKALESEVEVRLFPYGENPSTWPGKLADALDAAQTARETIAVPPDTMRFLELELINKSADNISYISATEIFKCMMSRKNEKEIESIKEAIAIAEKSLLSLLKEPLAGKTEKQAANLLVAKLLENGSDPDLPFFPIVASGPNSANPHAIPGDREIKSGDLLIIDWGARCQGYISDITRTFMIGRMTKKIEEISEIVLKANTAAITKANVGIKASEIDRAARQVIIDSGYGDFFIHRTGHGIGLQAHEEPYISESSSVLLEAGMTFTIEPGVYLSGKGGVRIEDDILINGKGSITLTSLPGEVIEIE